MADRPLLPRAPRMRPGHPRSKLVKSAVRALAILQHLDSMRRPCTVTQIALSLGYPQSSTTALLRSMVSIGYLVHEPHERTYHPSARVALLGGWRGDLLLTDGKLITMMKALHAEVGETVALGMRNGTSVQYIHIQQSPSNGQARIPTGYSKRLATCAGGLVLMAAMTGEQATRIVLRHNAEAVEGARLLSVRDTHAELDRIRARGYAATYDVPSPGGGMIAACLPAIDGQGQMVLAVGGRMHDIRDRERIIAQAMLAQMRDYHMQNEPRAVMGSPATERAAS